MIYTNNYKDEEMSNSLLSNGGHKYRMLVYSLLCVLVSFVITMLLYSLDSTVIYDIIPNLVGANSKSMFVLMTVLTPILIIFVIAYYFGHYQDLTFAVLRTNRMYMLLKSGQNLNKVCFIRIFSGLLMPILLYSTSFILSLFVSLIFGYSLNVTSLPGLYLSGLILVTLTTVGILTLSLFSYKAKYAFLVFLFLFIGVWVGAILSNYTNLIQASINVSNLDVLFGPKTYYFLFICLGLIVILLIIAIIRSIYLVRFYNLEKVDTPNIVVLDYLTKEPTKIKKDNSRKKEKIFNGTIYTIFGIFAGVAFLTNIFLIYMATNSLETQNLYSDIVPVVFGSETLKQGDKEIDETLDAPQFIEKNDLVFFENIINKDYNIKAGNVIYYIDSDTSKAVIVKVLSIDENGDYKVDVTYYPNADDEGKMATTLTKSQIKGVLTYVNRPLGAWITINDSNVGKVVFLVFPLVVIIFFDKIKKITTAFNSLEEAEYYSKQTRKEKTSKK